MAEYNLGALSYLEFELLIRDLLQEEWSVPLESFKSGKDQGIDIRYLDMGTTIIQCKHFFESSFTNLKSHLKKDEKEKVERLKPDRYILVTSVELSPERKKELKEIFSPFCKIDSDILGREDILNLLNRHEKIVKRHHKLWFSGTLVLQEVLEKIVHHEYYAKTAMDLQEFQKIIPKIVFTKTYEEFEKIFDNHNACVICGNAGTGKTTMMKFFVLDYIRKGYQPILITENINEAYKMFKPEISQIFYYDDFLGQTFLEQNFIKNEDSQILLFIERNKNQKNKKFIFSTREYVLNQAETKSEKIKRVREYKFILNCSDFSLKEKAMILYNHLWHSQINLPNIEALIENKKYLKIVQHSNFNPRLIETMTNSKNVNRSDFIDVFIRTLDNPKELWYDTFEYQISSYARTILLIVGTFKHHIIYNQLWTAFKNYYSSDPYFEQTEYERHFRHGLIEVDDTFLKSNFFEKSSVIFFTFCNPSIRDFIQNYLLTEKTQMNKICENAIEFSQIQQIWDILKYGNAAEKINFDYLTQHIDISVYLKTIETFFNNDESFPFFEDKLLHLLNVSLEIQHEEVTETLKNKIILLTQRNFEGKTTQFETLFTLSVLFEKQKIFFQLDFSINYEKWIDSVKHAILQHPPNYINDFAIIAKFITVLNVKIDPSEMDFMKERLNLILDQGIKIDKDFKISSYSPDDDRFESIGFKIEGLESVDTDLEEICELFRLQGHPTIKKIKREINDYYSYLDTFDYDDYRDNERQVESSRIENEIEIDEIFQNLKIK